ncbi:hypothetical protein IQ255_00230 [Pleurocapsales cyanobacterium LEGE 10410]|nr:hypothetical protein [Pleurocapsales cyanobacterium LEGE 10410]
MSDRLIWQQNSNDSHNADHLSAIANWWSNLAAKEVVWRQRLIPASGDLQDVDWQPQKFDEKFVLQTPQLRGITIYWCNNKTTEERNITPNKLELDLRQQQLYVFPQSQSQVVISVSLPKTVYQKLNLVNPQIAATAKDHNGIILLRDEAQKLEITVTLDRERLNQLLDRFKNTDN